MLMLFSAKTKVELVVFLGFIRPLMILTVILSPIQTGLVWNSSRWRGGGVEWREGGELARGQQIH